MYLYLIRHGKTIDDALGKMQLDNSVLDSNYSYLLNKLKSDLSKITFDYVFTSPYSRCVETTHHLFSDNYSVLDYIFEYKRPKNLNKLPKHLVINFWERDFVKEKYDPDWKYQESESFNDILHRVQKLYSHLLSLESENIAIVGHGTFFRHLLGYAFFKEEYTPNLFFNFLLNGIILPPASYIKLEVGDTTRIVDMFVNS